jgi:uncharacterized protein YciI
VSTKYVVFYTSAEEVLQKAPAHNAHGLGFHQRGDLLMYGPFADAQAEGSMAIFRSREAAEEFVRGDPFVLNGVVSGWELREWNEGLVP